MLKLSFENFLEVKPKQIYKSEDGKTTIVILTGTVWLPDFLRHNLPDKVIKYINSYEGVKIHLMGARIIITSKGKAKRVDKDPDKPILGEYIAESKAKIKLYVFMKNFCKQIEKYYLNLLFSTDTFMVSGNADSTDTIRGTWNHYVNLLQKERQHLFSLTQSVL